ncbi:MAG: hypothetical protein AAF800_00670 [Planctomycetota bacterium]
MADPQPIKQRIEIDADTSGVEQVVGGLDRVEKETQQTAQKTGTYAQQARQLREELLELATAEDRHARAVEAGAEETDEARRESEERHRAMERLAREIADVEDREERLNRELRASVDARRQAGDATDETGRRTGFMAGKLDDAAGAIKGMVAGMIGAEGINKLMEAYGARVDAANRYLEENIRLTREAAQARLNLAALSGAETPEDVAFLGQVARFAARDEGDVARLQAQFTSQFPQASEDDIRALVIETAAFSQGNDAALSEVAPGIAAIYRQTGNARTAANLLLKGVEQAGEVDPGRFADALSKFLTVSGTIGGLDPGEGVGYFAGGTGIGLSADETVTALTASIYALVGEGTPAGQEIRDREGIDNTDYRLALSQFAEAAAAGRISRAEIGTFGGDSAAPLLAALADPQQFAAFEAKAHEVDAAEELPGRLSTDVNRGIFDSSRLQELNLLIGQFEEGERAVRRRDERALEAEAARQALGEVLAERVSVGQLTPLASERITERYDRMIARGRGIEQTVRRSLQTPAEPFIEFGDAESGRVGLYNDRLDVLFMRNGPRGRIAQEVLDRLEAGPQLDPDVIDPTATSLPSPTPRPAADPVEQQSFAPSAPSVIIDQGNVESLLQRLLDGQERSTQAIRDGLSSLALSSSPQRPPSDPFGYDDRLDNVYDGYRNTF